jgi:hypothetical protein
MTSFGPLSWQQAISLRRNFALRVGTSQLTSVVPIPEGTSTAWLHERLATIVHQEDALRITGLPQDGLGTVTYEDKIDLPISTMSVDSAAQLADLVSTMAQLRFTYEPGLLWKMVTVEHPDHTGRPTRTAVTAFDHHISDGASVVMFGERLLDRDETWSVVPPGGYQEWVQWQHRQFPMENTAGLETVAREFWRRYFDGGAPNLATVLPFSDPEAVYSGSEHNLFRDLTISSTEIRVAAARLKTTPFLLIIAGVAAAVGAFTGTEDLTMRYFSHGRTSRTIDMLGWFADNVPLRIRTTGMADPRQALRAANASRLELLEHEATPWGYIMEVCSETDFETPQILLNLIPVDESTLVEAQQAKDHVIESRRGSLYLNVYLPSKGIGVLRARFDPARFTVDGIDAFTQIVFAKLGDLVRPH